MAQPLRLMVYDRTCTGRPYLTQSWVAGAAIARVRRRLDAAFGAADWSEALDWLARHDADRQISEVQYWGHGKWGCAYIDSDRLDADALSPGHRFEARLAAIRDRLSPDATWWWRCCETYGATRGHDFAQRFSDFLGRKTAGHTYIIGPWQSGLHSLGPGEQPLWSASEGLKRGDADTPLEALWSRAWRPRTVNCLRMSVPAGW